MRLRWGQGFDAFYPSSSHLFLLLLLVLSIVGSLYSPCHSLRMNLKVGSMIKYSEDGMYMVSECSKNKRGSVSRSMAREKSF